MRESLREAFWACKSRDVCAYHTYLAPGSRYQEFYQYHPVWNGGGIPDAGVVYVPDQVTVLGSPLPHSDQLS